MKRAKISILTIVAVTAVAGCERTTVTGEGDRSMTLTKPAPVSVERGATAEVTIAIARTNITEPVEFEIENLPADVTAVKDEGQVSGDELGFVLEADEDADLVAGHEATVTIRGPENLEAKDTFEVTVREKSGSIGDNG